MMTQLLEIQSCLRAAIDVSVERQTRYFKTGPGHYAEHDAFLGVRVPVLRKIAKVYSDLPLELLQVLIDSRFNEERLLALIILVMQYQLADIEGKAIRYEFYLKNLKQVNNWNLVDSSAHLIMGSQLFNADKIVLKHLAASTLMWERRIAIVATWYFIQHDELDSTFEIAYILRHDSHDLIHKAVGWMLREAGKRDEGALIDFLDKYAPSMPRTMLRYAIEKFGFAQRKHYLMIK